MHILHMLHICSTTRLSAVVKQGQWVLGLCERIAHVLVLHQYFKLHRACTGDPLPNVIVDTWD